MAQDFAAAFDRKVSEKQAVIETLTARNAELEQRLSRLEALVAKLMPQMP